MASNIPRILFVDDEQNVLQALERTLRAKRGEWEMEFVESGVAAMDMVREQRVDVVVTDLAMPGMSGVELVGHLNEVVPETKCLILTGTADLQTAAEVINTVRVFRFYTKPCVTERLIEGISAACAEAPRRTGDPVRGGQNSEVLDRLSTGVIVVTDRTEVVYMNQYAANTIAAADGLTVGIDQLLKASTGNESRELRDACEAAGAREGGNDNIALSISRPSMREALKLILSPLENTAGDADARIMILIMDPAAKSALSAEMLAQFFQLTPTEGRLAWHLIQGRRTEEIAASMGVTVSSARTYMKRIMEKTGTNRQADLVRFLLHTPGVPSNLGEGTSQK